MAKRQTIESRVITYFRTAPLAQAELVFGIVLGEVRLRRADVRTVEGATGAPKKRRARRMKANAGAPTAAQITASNAEALEQ